MSSTNSVLIQNCQMQLLFERFQLISSFDPVQSLNVYFMNELIVLSSFGTVKPKHIYNVIRCQTIRTLPLPCNLVQRLPQTSWTLVFPLIHLPSTPQGAPNRTTRRKLFHLGNQKASKISYPKSNANNG